MLSDSRQAGAERTVEVTPEMIEAGVAELREKAFGEPLERIVQDVFRVMLCATE